MLLDRGRLLDVGDPTSIARQYNGLSFERGRHGVFERGELQAGQSVPAEILHAWFESASGETLVSAPQGEHCRLKLDVRFHEDTNDPVFSIGLFDEAGHVAFVAHSHFAEARSGYFRRGQKAQVTIEFENWLAPGRYHLTASVGADTSNLYDKREDFGTLIVFSTKATGGVVDLPHAFRIDRT
jgi:Wzt C-terminal domain